jgi:serine protease Do
LQYLVSTSDIGKSYPVTFLRKGKEMTTKVSPEPLSEVAAVMRPNAQVDERPQAVSKDEVNDFGIAVTGLNDELAERYGWAGKKGVMISSVKPESPAAAAGLEVGDLITKVIKDETIASVESVEDFEAVVKDSKEIAVYVEDVNHRLPGDFKVLAKPESK